MAEVEDMNILFIYLNLIYLFKSFYIIISIFEVRLSQYCTV